MRLGTLEFLIHTARADRIIAGSITGCRLQVGRSMEMIDAKIGQAGNDLEIA
jgi:hypothetical protein